MHSRRSSPAATKRFLTAVLTLGLAALPLIAPARAKSGSAAPPSASSSAQTPNGASAVFDAPGMPGVRMMAPIPDKPAPAPASAAKRKAAPARTATAADHAVLVQAFAAAGRDWNRARRLAAQAGSQVGRLIVEWRYVLDETSGANFETINAFLDEHPNWPRHDALTIRAEKTMPAEFDSNAVIGWYANRAPLSGLGMIRLGTALMETGKRAEGEALIRKAWIERTFTPADENDIVAAHDDVLGPPEQKARLLRLLANDDIGGARRQMQRVDAATQRLANGLLKIKASPATAKAVLASFPESARNDPELLFEAARALRRRGQDEDAWALMTKAPVDKDALVLAERWSVERQIMARDALRAGQPDLAYQFASAPALDADVGATFMDAEFLSGWIALQYLHKPDLAFHHFDRLAKGVTYPISVARAHYWLARTDEAMNHPDDAAAEYRIAAAYPATFYGQLALARIADSPILHVKATVSDPLPSERAGFETDDRVQAIRMLSEFGDRANARLFALAIASDPPDPKRLQLLAQLMATVGDSAMSVRVAKNASYNEVYLPSYLHPVLALPNVRGDAPEPALVLGLTRQESEFDPGAVSSAGARGLMQLMPASAKRAASISGLAYRPKNLTTPAYNMQLGMATLSEYLDRWDGSYILAIASYNAGPANVRNWVDVYGDPRDAGVDPIDWIESIPYPETRNYVERVLENLEVYRNRLSNADQKLGILADLYRPNGVNYASGAANSVAASGASGAE